MTSPQGELPPCATASTSTLGTSGLARRQPRGDRGDFSWLLDNWHVEDDDVAPGEWLLALLFPRDPPEGLADVPFYHVPNACAAMQYYPDVERLGSPAALPSHHRIPSPPHAIGPPKQEWSSTGLGVRSGRGDRI